MPLATLSLHPFKLVLEITGVSVEKPLLLYEIAKHKTVEHYRRIPLPVPMHGFRSFNTRNESDECPMLLLESCIKVLCELFGIDCKTILNTCAYVHNGRDLIKTKSESVDFL